MRRNVTKYLELDKFILATNNVVSRATIRKFSYSRCAPFSKITRRRFFRPTVLLNGLRSSINDSIHIYDHRVWINGVSEEMMRLDLSVGDTLSFCVNCTRCQKNSLGNVQHVYLDCICDVKVVCRAIRRRLFDDFLVDRVSRLYGKYEFIPMHWNRYIHILRCRGLI